MIVFEFNFKNKNKSFHFINISRGLLVLNKKFVERSFLLDRNDNKKFNGPIILMLFDNESLLDITCLKEIKSLLNFYFGKPLCIIF
ncbi:hypothetical protein BpHYR1_017336 [Brachionus plicatilis]|uniref:Uncharacterized protein n=1 Tax=Brachionus plicatilis TaxID=10195 RepID=A0A3M7Q176_BRAPC|nr:hypothetical protein BpHYR1_017336 [Brachionus plicatilis]